MVKVVAAAFLVASVAARDNSTTAAQEISWSTGSGYASTSVSAGEPVTFTYTSSHDVWKFDDSAAYEACDFRRATQIADRGDSPFTLNAPAGNSYYGCDVGSHCSSGNQKIELVAPALKAASKSIEWSTGSGYVSTDVAVGEDVTFVYSSSHDVWQFDDFSAYQACDFGRATQIADRGDSPFTLTAPAGNSYYGCDVGSHCSSGNQKIELVAPALRLKSAAAAKEISWSTGSGYASTAVAEGEAVTFTYSSSHDVWQFDDFNAYQACDFGRATQIADRGDSPFTLLAPAGNSYYGCDVGSHCSSGNQKIELVAPSKLQTVKRAIDINWATGSGYASTSASVGEDVTFTYSSSHDVWQFDDFAAYEACNFRSATKIADRGDSPFTIQAAPGNSYYGCDVGSHCSSGNQKIEIVA